MFFAVIYVALIFILGEADACNDLGGSWLEEHQMCDYGSKERCLAVGGTWVDEVQACD